MVKPPPPPPPPKPLTNSKDFCGIKDFYNFIRRKNDNTPSSHSISVLSLYPHARYTISHI